MKTDSSLARKQRPLPRKPCPLPSNPPSHRCPPSCVAHGSAHGCSTHPPSPGVWAESASRIARAGGKSSVLLRSGTPSRPIAWGGGEGEGEGEKADRLG